MWGTKAAPAVRDGAGLVGEVRVWDELVMGAGAGRKGISEADVEDRTVRTSCLRRSLQAVRASRKRSRP